MSFLTEMLSSDAKISSKRTVGFAAFFMLICSWGADTFSTFEVKDKQGVLSLITNRLAKYKISVKRIIQTPDKKNKKATIVIISHKTTEKNIKNCLSIFKKNKNILKFPTLIRLYN